MSDAWSQPSDIDRLADRQADIDFVIPLAQLPRLRSHLASTDGTVRGVVHFRREAGFRIAAIELEGAALLTCQRCLEPMRWPVDGAARVALVAAESDADRVPQQFESVLVPDDRVSVRDLVEEEMLLSLPIVALHADARDCGAAAADIDGTASDADVPDTQRPFERLGELLKRNS
jgi:uncharacterized protein